MNSEWDRSEEIQASIGLLNLDAVQLSMYAEDKIAKTLKENIIIKEWITDDLTYIDKFAAQCESMGAEINYFYLNLEKSGISWEDLRKNEEALLQLKNLCKEYSIIISIVCPASDLENFLEELKPYGISLEGGEEEEVGLKTFDDLDEIYDVLEAIGLLNQEI